MAKYRITPSSKAIMQLPISIGHKAEKGVEAIEFDVTAWVETYGSGALTVIMRRWGDAIPYPIALEIDENNKATWVLSDTDTARAGMAYAQLSYIVGETVVKKSDIYTFRVMNSLTGEGDPPEAYESWLEHLTHLAAEAMAEVLDIEEIVTDKTLSVDGGIADAKATGDALALKADKSTTYTKTEVDALIDEVEVETDTTLEIAGAPADAKKVGDELSDIKADLADGFSIVGLSASGLESGGIDNSYANVTSDSRVRTGFINSGSIRLILPSGMKAKCYFYDSSKTGISYTNYKNGEYLNFSNSSAKFIRLAIGYADDSTISASDFNAINEAIRIYFDSGTKYAGAVNDLFLQKLTGGYVPNSGASIGEVTASESYVHAVVPVLKGEKYLVCGRGSISARLWSTHDAQGYTVRQSDANANISVPVVLTIGDNETTLVFNSMVSSVSIVCERTYGEDSSLNSIKEHISGVENILETATHYTSETLTSGYYKNNASPVSTTQLEGSYVSAFLSVNSGDKFEICGMGSNAARLYSTLDAEYNIKRVAVANEDHRTDPLLLTIMPGEVYLVVNLGAPTSTRPATLKRINERIGLYDYAHNELASKQSKSLFNIGNLDSGFTSDIPCTVSGTKGDPSASYTFSVPLKENYNIRAKFRLTDKLINSGASSYDIVSLEDARAYVTVVGLEQYSKLWTVDGTVRTNYFPCLKGGVVLNGATWSDEKDQNIGDFAFSIKYTGENASASIQVTDSALILVDSSTHTFTLANYTTMQDLYNVLEELTDYEVTYNSLEGYTPADLAVFSQTNLINTSYVETTAVTASATFFVPYALDKKWHQIEIVCIGNTIYSTIDGITVSSSRSTDAQTSQDIVFGGDCGVLFRDVEIDVSSKRDAEVVTALEGTRIISSVNPYIIIFEGHGMEDVPNVDVSESMSCSSDRIQFVADTARKLGYVPVSVADIIDFCDGKKLLPKRSYTIIFDDYQFANFCNLKNRRAFTRNGLKPSLAVITSDSHTITHNGVTITIDKAITIGKNCGFTFYSHTKNHTDLERTVSPDALISTFTECIYDADDKGVDGMVLIYPYGHANKYVFDTLKFLGYKAAIDIERPTSTLARSCSKYDLPRRELGIRKTLSDLLAFFV